MLDHDCIPLLECVGSKFIRRDRTSRKAGPEVVLFVFAGKDWLDRNWFWVDDDKLFLTTGVAGSNDGKQAEHCEQFDALGHLCLLTAITRPAGEIAPTCLNLKVTVALVRPALDIAGLVSN
jgi:hypothetical protein